MSSVSRRSVLGYTGTAAAGAVLPTVVAGSAQAAEAKSEAQADQAGATGVVFPNGTLFKAVVHRGSEDDEIALSFTLGAGESSGVTPAEVANLLSTYVQSKGWPALTFYGTPAVQPLN